MVEAVHPVPTDFKARIGPTELAELLTALFDGGDVVAGPLPGLAGEAGRDMREEHLGLPDPTGV